MLRTAVEDIKIPRSSEQFYLFCCPCRISKPTALLLLLSPSLPNTPFLGQQPFLTADEKIFTDVFQHDGNTQFNVFLESVEWENIFPELIKKLMSNLERMFAFYS